MSRFFSSRNRSPLAGWLGLAVVWSGVFWLGLLMLLLRAGWPAGAVAVGVRLLLTLAIGVGLCALEKWAWATAVCLAAFYAVVGGGVAAVASWTWASAPRSTLSWLPLLWGLNVDQLLRVASVAWPVTALSGGGLWLLWREQAHFSVPYRRVFTSLLQDGPWPALLVILCDAFLLWGWWSGVSR